MYITPYVNDASTALPTLEHHLNLFSINRLPKLSKGPRFSLNGMNSSGYERIKEDGFNGIQSHIMLSPSIEKSNRARLSLSAAAILKPKQLETKVIHFKKSGYRCATLMIGSGNESLSEAFAIAEKVLTVSKDYNFPLYLELHRGTVTQCINRVLKMIKAYPGLKFNGDFSHYIVSYRWQEFFDTTTLKKISPILKRVAYLHLRPASSNSIQTVHWQDDAFTVYKALLQTTFFYFLKQAKPGDKLIATPELLPMLTGYCQYRRNASGHQEFGDRYQQSLLLKELVTEWFNEVKQATAKPKLFTKPTNHNKLTTSANPIIRINHSEDWDKLAEPELKHANILRIALGNGVESIEEQTQLISSYLKLQHKDSRVCLDTMRGSLTHTLTSTLQLQRQFPDIRLCLNVSEWVLGEEITINKLWSFKKDIKKLNNISACCKTYATAEHSYSNEIHYRWKAKLSNSVIVERLYTRFYTRLWDRIPAPQLNDMALSRNTNHQAILYAREQLQKA